MSNVPKLTISSFPMAESAQVASSSSSSAKRKKVRLAPGHSQLDWMKRTTSGEDMNGAGGAVRKISMEEVALHNTEDDAWMVISGAVYNVTKYIGYHPGGKDQLLRGAGRDATDLFFQVHPWVNIQMMLKSCVLGIVANVPYSPPAPSPSPSSSPSSSSSSSNPYGFAPWSLAEVRVLTPSTSVFCFSPPPGEFADVPLGGHVYLKADSIGEDGAPVVRPYTPINSASADAGLELLIKRYPDGPMSSHVHSLAVGDTLLISDPELPTDLVWEPQAWSAITLLAAGTGITPMVRIIEEAALIPNIQSIHLIYSNSSGNEMALKDQLDALIPSSPLTIDYIVSQDQGRLDAPKLQALIDSPPGDHHHVFVCGPPSFNATMYAHLIDTLGHFPEALTRFAPPVFDEDTPAGQDGGAAKDPSSLPEYTMDQVAGHASESDAWMVLNDLVYDVTSFVQDHPGGAVILDGAGKDATTLFHNSFHSPYARRLLDKFLIGRIVYP